MYGSSVLVYGRAERPPTDFSAPCRPLQLGLRVCEVGSECHQVLYSTQRSYRGTLIFMIPHSQKPYKKDHHNKNNK